MICKIVCSSGPPYRVRLSEAGHGPALAETVRRIFALAEHRELERIIPEKTKAFSASNAVLIEGLGEMAEQAAGFVINEMAIATRMTSELALCRTPAALLGLQSRSAME